MGDDELLQLVEDRGLEQLTNLHKVAELLATVGAQAPCPEQVVVVTRGLLRSGVPGGAMLQSWVQQMACTWQARGVNFTLMTN